MKFYLRDRNLAIVDAWKKFFGDNPEFEVSSGDIFLGAPKADAIVSPANSFGYMDGGIDYIYSMKFGWQLQDRLQVLIKKQFNGEVPVGMVAVIETNDKDYPWLISAPTMRVPMVVKGTVNAYLAFRAVLLELKKRNDIQSVLCPGLGTAVGEMTPWCCAKQMHEAYKTIWLEQPIDPKALDDAYYHHQQMSAWDRFLKQGNV